jgi:hypothetical protein
MSEIKFNFKIKDVLQNVQGSPTIKISRKAEEYIINLLSEIHSRILLSKYPIKDAIKSVLVGKLYDHAIMSGNRAMNKYDDDVFLTAILEYLAAEILSNSLKFIGDRKIIQITHIDEVFNHDIDLKQTFL